jgi:prevent-host-death family protein
MAVRIGVRELKNRASAIVREVREAQASYVVTVRGEPVAELRPLGVASLRESRQEAADQVMREVEDLALRISRAWKTSKTGIAMVEEQRR